MLPKNSELIRAGLRSAAAEAGFKNSYHLVEVEPELALRGIVKAFGGDKEAAASAIVEVLIPIEDEGEK